MKTRNKKLIYYICSILILVTIVLFFILTEKRVLIDWLGFGFIIATELILMIGLLFLQSERGDQELTVLYPGMYSVIGLYTILSIVVSFLYMILFRGGAKYLISIQIVLLAAYLIIMALIFNISHHVGKANATTLYSVNKMQGLLNRVVILQNINKNTALGQKLNKLYDSIRFCDVSATVATDEIIAAKLTELQTIIESNTEEPVEAAVSLIDEIMVLMKQRTMEISIIKSGGI